MKNITLSTLFFLISFSLLAQTQPKVDSYAYNFNKFQDTKERYPDSALYFLHNIAIYAPHGLEDLVHNQFAQAFDTFVADKMFSDTAALAYFKKMNMTVDSARRRFQLQKQTSYELLNKITADTNKLIQKNAYPIAQWAQAEDSMNKPAKLKEIGNSYLRYLKNNADLYAERKGRYGLMIADLMLKHPQLKSEATQLIQLIYANLKDHQVIENPEQLSRALQYKRAWYRYLFAYANFISARESKDKAQKIGYLKFASDYSPDVADKTVKSAYFYDMIFLVKEEDRSFEADYIAALDSNEEKFKQLLAHSMTNPSIKVQAKSLYKEPAKFQVFWLNEFNNTFKPAPVFTLSLLDGKPYKLAPLKNQWTLIDFWGTWCPPCRAEHPTLEKLYQQTKTGKLANLNIITIASRDNETAVRAYIKEFNYTFPVVISDDRIEGAYHVSSWPSKFLVSPQGVYVTIPYNVDWVKYIEDYIQD